MSAERIIRAALRAYPREVRRARGDEMAATVLDLSEGSRSALLRETLALAYGGLSARAGVDPETTTRGLADICVSAATIWGSVALCIRLGTNRAVYEAHMFGGLATHAVIIDGLLALSIGSALLNHQRLAGLSGLAWIGVFLESGLRTRVGIDTHVLVWSMHSVALVLIPLCGYVVMLLTPEGKRRRHPVRLGWLAGVILLGIVVAPPGGPLGPGRWFEAIVLPLMVIAGVMLVPSDALLRQAFPKNRQYVVADPYLRFWLRFIAGAIDTIDRGRGELILADVQQNFSAFRGRAIEPIIRDAIERLLPDERFGTARYVGAYWNRNKSIEVDLIGGDKHPTAEQIDFIGSIKWRDEQPFDRRDSAALAAKLLSIPGANTSTKLLGVCHQGFKQPSGLDIEIGPEQIIAAYGVPTG